MVDIVASSDAALDMYETALASALTPTITLISSEKILLSFDYGFIDVLEGNGFVLDENGLISSGTVHAITESRDEKVSFRLTGATLPAAQLMDLSRGDYLATFPAILTSSNNIKGSNLADRIYSGHGNDSIQALGGDDEIEAGRGINVIDGGDGFDTVILEGSKGDYQFLHTDQAEYLISVNNRVRLTAVEGISFAGESEDFLVTDLKGQLNHFDGLLYLASNSDLRAGYGSNKNLGLAHFANHGFYEGRGVPSFDPYAYIAANQDLRVGYGMDTNAAVRHYVEHGAAEQRNITFGGLEYIASYSDLIQGFGPDAERGVKHYIQHGATENRSIIFDSMEYLATNPTLIHSIAHDAESIAYQYITSGFHQGLAVDGFDPLEYIASYADLIVGFGSNADLGTKHFVEHGFDEGRSITFDPVRYASANPDLEAAYGFDGDKLALHYIMYGLAEGRHFASDAMGG